MGIHTGGGVYVTRLAPHCSGARMPSSDGSTLRTLRNADGAFLLPGAIACQCGSSSGPVQLAAKTYVGHTARGSSALQDRHADNANNTARVARISSRRILVLLVSHSANLENLPFSYQWHGVCSGAVTP